MTTGLALRVDRDTLAFELERLQDTLTRLIDGVDEGHWPTPRDVELKHSINALLASTRAAFNRCEGMATGDLEPLRHSERDLVYVTDAIITGYRPDAERVEAALKNAQRLILEPAD
jgi:hypothetical protein